MATFNTCILGTLLIGTTRNFNLLQTMGFALGSGLGYVLALLVCLLYTSEGHGHGQHPQHGRGHQRRRVALRVRPFL